MKEKELRDVAICNICRKPFGESGLPMFWRVTVERHGVDMRSVQRQEGLGMMLGSPALAQVMGPDEETTKPLMDPVTVTICESCIMKSLFIPSLIEDIEDTDHE